MMMSSNYNKGGYNKNRNWNNHGGEGGESGSGYNKQRNNDSNYNNRPY